MAVYVEGENGNILLVKKGQTMEELVKKIKAEQTTNGGKVSPCVKDILETKQKLKDKGVL